MYVFPVFLKAGKHKYMVKDNDNEFFLHKFISNIREEDIPICKLILYLIFNSY
jgi:hypothetical protein